MKINFRAVIGLVLIAVVVYVVATSIMSTSASGTELTLDSSSGYVTVLNSNDTPVAARLTARSAFRVTVSGDEPTELVSAREGSGRNVVQAIEAELPPGDVVLTITRGSDVTFQLTSEENIQATAVPRNENDTRTMLIIGAVIILGLLFYVSNTTNHALLRQLRSGRRPAAAEPVSA